MEILGIDFGGSGIKGAPVDTQSGTLLAPRFRLPTPSPSKPQAVAETIAQIVNNFTWQGPIGCGYPGVVQNGFTMSAANVHKQWIGLDAVTLIANVTGCQTYLINDADAAGIAEMTFGAGLGRKGVVLIVTVGTGLGTALFKDGFLMPNTEFGHIEIDCKDAETYATDAARKRLKLSWKRWGRHLNTYLLTMEKLISPDLIILGGGVSKEHDRFMPYLTTRAEIVPAQMLNEAGIVGAALAARLFLSTSANPSPDNPPLSQSA
jgi:polyphosphate glucokinase